MAVLAIHGVANRSRESFGAVVQKLEAVSDGALTGLQPVFWGDLGPEGPLASIPGSSDVAELPVPAGGLAAAPPADVVAAAEETVAAAVAELQGRSEVDTVPDATVEVLREAALEAATAGYTLALTTSLAPLLADTVMAAAPQGTAELQPAGAFGLGGIKDALVGVFRHTNDLVVDLLVDAFRTGEAGLDNTIARSLGDVFVYQSRGQAIRGRLDAAYRAASTGGEPVDVIAHSLGALVTVEWLLGASAAADDGRTTPPAERRVRHLVTFGTQVSLFSELLGLRREGDGFGAGPGSQSLAIQVESWTNIWQELDPLAFVMGRVLHIDTPAGPLAIDDRRLTQQRIPTDLSFHSSYWGDRRFAAWLGRHLKG